MKSNDWGESQEIGADKWEDFSSSASSPPPPPPPTTSASKPTGVVSWTQDKPSPAKNDWDTDAFFNDVLTTSTKPKLKTTRR